MTTVDIREHFVVKTIRHDAYGVSSYAIREINAYNTTKDGPHLAKMISYKVDDEKTTLFLRRYAGDMTSLFSLPYEQRVSKAAAAFLQLRKALICLHNAGMFHLDIKPQNIFVDDDNFYLGDFGLIAFSNCDDTVAAERFTHGSPLYMAPEQFTGQFTNRTDCIGLGLSLLSLILGQEYGNYYQLYEEYSKDGGLDINQILPQDIGALVSPGMKYVLVMLLKLHSRDRMSLGSTPCNEELKINDRLVSMCRDYCVDNNIDITPIPKALLYDCVLRAGSLEIIPTLANLYGQKIPQDLENQITCLKSLGYIIKRCIQITQ